MFTLQLLDLKLSTLHSYGGKDTGTPVILQQYSTQSPVTPSNPFSATPTSHSEPDSPIPSRGIIVTANGNLEYNPHVNQVQNSGRLGNMVSPDLFNQSMELSRSSCKGSQELYNPTYEEISTGMIKYLFRNFTP